MLVAATIIGAVGGVIGLVLGFAIQNLHAIGGQTIYQILSIAAPVVTLLGGALALARPMLAASLMMLGAIGMYLAFEFSWWKAIPMVLAVVGAGVAAVGAKRARGPARPTAT